MPPHVFGLLASALALGPLLAATHLDLRREAQQAYQQKNYPAALAATAEALRLRPDSPRYLHNLAALSVLTGDQPAALNYLRRLAALGVVTDIERDPDLGPLQGTPEFLRLLELFAANRAPQGNAQLLAELPGRTGILEGIAFREKTGDVFLADVHHRCIWRRDRAGDLTRFSAEDESLFGIFGLALDEPRGALWAATAAVPEMSGFDPEFKGHAALAEFDLRTGELRRLIPAPLDGREHGLGDVALASDGTILLTDSKTPALWRYTPGADELEKLLESPAFSSLQGLIVQGKSLLVADYSHGLLLVDLPTGNVTALAPPPNATLLGIDGLAALSSPDGLVLYASQNGVTPQRILRLTLSPDLAKIADVKVLAAAHPHLTDLSLLTFVHDRPTVIAGAGWDAFEAAKSKPPPPRTVHLFSTDP